MKLSAVIDLIGKNLSRIKTIGMVLIIVLFIISLANNGCNRSNIESMVEKVTGLNVRNDILQSDIKVMDSVLITKSDSIRVLKSKIEQSEKDSKVLNRKYTHIKGKYDNIASKLIKLSTDESYAFLDTVAYPYGGVKKYPFSEPQVKGIHKTYLENESLISLNDNLQDQKNELIHQVSLQDALTLEHEGSILIMDETRVNLEQIIENKDTIIETNEKQLKKAKRKAFFVKLGIGIGALLIGFVAGGA